MPKTSERKYSNCRVISVCLLHIPFLNVQEVHMLCLVVFLRNVVYNTGKHCHHGLLKLDYLNSFDHFNINFYSNIQSIFLPDIETIVYLYE